MTFAIKAGVSDPAAETFAFRAQKTMYWWQADRQGDRIFVFASENEGGPELGGAGTSHSAFAASHLANLLLD